MGAPSPQVAAELVAFGRELEAEAAAQNGESFSDLPGADELIYSSPEAFLLAVLFTQGIPAERAWAGPYLLKQRLGTLDLEYLAEHPEQVRAAVQVAPMLHRFKETMPRWIVAAAQRVLAEYGGDVTAIWAPGSTVIEVTERLSEFDGIGRKKAVMTVEILGRTFGVELAGKEHGSVAYDVHVRRVLLRSGLADEDTPQAMDAAARLACPEAPGTIDLAAWLIGRQTCRPRVALCDTCRLGAVCPRQTWIQVEGVGGKRRGA